ncbi:MAG: PCMD domain-containing protein [Alistipes sp.]|nr:PCMD domain-containing protein [Alistipes sp.]
MTKRVVIILFSALALASCIKNDLPMPMVDLYIASLDVEGANGDILLDRSTYTATIPLAEETNINAVKFNSITYGAEVETNINYTADESKIVASRDLNGKVVNMSRPEIITLSYFQNYEWKIVATQNINRIWRVDGQIGETEWDLEGHRAIVKRRNDRPLSSVKTDTLRLGPKTYSYMQRWEEDFPTNFDNSTNSRDISVLAPWEIQPTTWKLVVVPTLAEPEFKYIGAGANVIWIKAIDIDGSDIVFKYREKVEEGQNENEWIATKDNWYASASVNSPYNRYEQGYVKAVIRGLKQNTTYEIQGWANTVKEDGSVTEIPSKTFTVTTSEPYEMPNSDMEQWGKFTNDPAMLPTGETGFCDYPFSSVQNMFWASGNPGATTLGPDYNLTKPSNDVPVGSAGTKSAYMASRYVVVKFAAGNLFVGYYGATDGTNAYVYFGKPISQSVRPTALRCKIKYYCGGVDYVSSKKATNGVEYHFGDKQIPIKGGDPDLAKVFFCVTDWSAPHCIYSKEESTFFDPHTTAGVLGLGYFDSYTTPEPATVETSAWHEMTLPIEHKSFESTTSYLVLTFTCSGYGDYFTGSTSSWMYVDDIELLYDLDENNQPK